MTTDDTLTYTPPRSRMRLATPLLTWGSLLLLSGLIALADEEGSGFTTGLIVWTLICGGWFLGVALRPRLTMTREGITWKPRWGKPRMIPWSEVTEVSAAEAIEAGRTEKHLVDHLRVKTSGDELHIQSGGVLEPEDVRGMARLMAVALARFAPGVEMKDPDGMAAPSAGSGAMVP